MRFRWYFLIAFGVLAGWCSAPLLAQEPDDEATESTAEAAADAAAGPVLAPPAAENSGNGPTLPPPDEEIAGKDEPRETFTDPAGNLHSAMPESGQRAAAPSETGRIAPAVNVDQNLPAYLGVTLDADASDAAVVDAVAPNSPAELARLQPGDVIEAINGEPMRGYQDVLDYVAALRPGDLIDIDFSRRVTGRTQAVLNARAGSQVSVASGESSEATTSEDRATEDIERERSLVRPSSSERVELNARLGAERSTDSRQDFSAEEQQRRDEASRRARDRDDDDDDDDDDRPFRGRGLLRWRRN